jgi:FeS assembly SUF system regulator
MIRLTRLADYAVVLMSHIANRPDRLHNAPDIAAETRLPAPTVSKVLKALARAALLTSRRGIKGGYKLARAPEKITIAGIISAVDGPIAVTECIEDAPGDCDYEAFCPLCGNWQKINSAINQALEQLSLADMISPLPPFVAMQSIHRERTTRPL